MIKFLTLKLIRFYQRWLSVDQGALFRPLHLKVCRFEPYCSEYTYQSIEKYGVLKGGVKGFWRILRCNPFTQGGYDPVK